MPAAVGNLKVCSKCRTERALDQYVRNSQSSDGLHPWCTPCKKARTREFYQANREHIITQQRWKQLKHRYGLTRAGFELMLAEQGGLCAICRGPQVDSRDAYLCVDHDHETGVVRGLLCTPCNLAIGYMKDDPTRLLAAVDYLGSGSDRC